jgi:hypothetical protein
MKTTIQSENLSSIMIYTGSSYLDAASYLANREYGSYISDLGYLGRTRDLKSYWTNYPELLYEETEYKFDKIKDIYDEAQSYLTSHDDFANNGVITITELNGNNKTISRYHAEYSYQTNLNNNFSNIVPYSAEDINDFLFAINYQKYNKEVMYGSEYELNSVRIGSKTFNWHLSSDIAYTNVSVESTELSYFFAYIIDDDNNVTYFYNADDYLANTISGTSYAYTYDYTDNVYTYDHYYYGANNFYTYIGRQYLPIIDTLKDVIGEQVSEFENRHGNNEELYTYYMYDCSIDIPMTLTTRSLGTKKSTFELRYSSLYDNWFEYSIPMNMKLNGTTSFTVTAYEDSTFGVRMNENDKVTESDTVILANETSQIEFSHNSNDIAYMSILTPYSMKALDLSNAAQHIQGALNLTYSAWSTRKGNHLESLIIGSENINGNITKILGINDLYNLKYLDISNISNLVSTPAIARLNKLSTFKAKGSNIQSFKPAQNTEFERIELPDTITNIRLQNVTIDEDNFDYTINSNLNSLVLDNVSGLDTYKFVCEWNSLLKTNNSLVPQSLIYLELNDIDWNIVPVTIMEDIKKFDLNIKNAEISVVGTSIYGMLSREEYIKMTKLYGVNAFYNLSTNEKVFPNLKLTKYVNSLPDFEYTFTISSEGQTKTFIAEFDNTDNPNTIIAVNAVVGNLIKFNDTTGELEDVTYDFTIDRHEKYIFHKLSNIVDTKDTLPSSSQLDYGDIVLYNGDTILIMMDYIANPKFQFIKLGNVNDSRQDLLYWFLDENVINLTFRRNEKPKVVSKIIVNYNENEIDEIIEYETVFSEGIDIFVDVDEHEATNKTIIAQPSSLDIDLTNNGNGKYNIKLNERAQIPMYGKKEYTIKFCLDGKVPSTNIDLKDIIYKELKIVVKSIANTDTYVTENIMVIDPENASFDDTTGILTISEDTASFDETTGILTIE